jgi:hypothetical protein
MTPCCHANVISALTSCVNGVVRDGHDEPATESTLIALNTSEKNR